MKFENAKRRIHPLELSFIMFLSYYIFSNPMFLSMGIMFIIWFVVFLIIDIVGNLFRFAMEKYNTKDTKNG